MRGWKALTALLGLVLVLCGIGTWAFITYLVPAIVPIGPLWPAAPSDIPQHLARRCSAVLSHGELPDAFGPKADDRPPVYPRRGRTHRGRNRFRMVRR